MTDQQVRDPVKQASATIKTTSSGKQGIRVPSNLASWGHMIRDRTKNGTQVIGS